MEIDYSLGFNMRFIMKKILSLVLVSVMYTAGTVATFANTHGTDRNVSGKSIAGGIASLLIWPGIGQMVNDQKTDKVVTHALLGLTCVFRFWSCYDGIANRNGGVWQSRI